MTAEKPSIRDLFLWCAVALPLAGYVASGAGLHAAASMGIEEGELLRFQRAARFARTSTAPAADKPAILAGAPVVLPGVAPLEAVHPIKNPLPPGVITPPLPAAVPAKKVKRRRAAPPVVKPVNKHFQRLIHQAATRHRIEPAMIQAIIMAESGFDPAAVSDRGAQGLMQLMPETAESLGVADAFDPQHNIDAGVRYFRQLLNHFKGDITLALAAYNAGLQNVLDHNGVPPFEATQRYVEKVLVYYEHYKRMLTSEERQARKLS